MPDHEDPMRNHEQFGSDDPFIERVALPLRRPESLRADFEARLMSSVRSESTALYPVFRHEKREAAWWRRPRAIHASPLAALGMAAGFATLVALATLAGAGRMTSAPRVAAVPAPDTVHVVRFVIAEPGARSVALVGTFNGWAAASTPLVPAGAPGVWSVSVPLEKGRHEYAFIVDGERWIADPAAPVVTDEFSTPSSIVAVGDSHCAAVPCSG